MTNSVTSGSQSLPNTTVTNPTAGTPIVAGGGSPITGQQLTSGEQSVTATLVNDALIAILGAAAPITGGGANAPSSDPNTGLPAFVRAFLPGGSTTMTPSPAMIGYAQTAPMKYESAPQYTMLPGYAPGYSAPQQGAQQGYVMVRCPRDHMGAPSGVPGAQGPTQQTPTQQTPPPSGPPSKDEAPVKGTPPAKTDGPGSNVPPPPPGMSGDWWPSAPSKGGTPPPSQGKGDPSAPTDMPPPPGKVDAPAQTGPVAPPAKGDQGTYTVVKSDNLTRIGNRYGVKWQAIYEANKDQIKDPNLIYPGQVLTIPACDNDATQTPPAAPPAQGTGPAPTPPAPPSGKPPTKGPVDHKDPNTPPANIPPPTIGGAPTAPPAPPAPQPGLDATLPSQPPVPAWSTLPPTLPT